jgi:hypothetical protein
MQAFAHPLLNRKLLMDRQGLRSPCEEPAPRPGGRAAQASRPRADHS